MLKLKKKIIIKGSTKKIRNKKNDDQIKNNKKNKLVEA
jgi:hypothetical protein